MAAGRHCSSILLTHHLENHSFSPLPIEFGVVDLLPGSEIEFTLGHWHYHLVMHQQALQMCFYCVPHKDNDENGFRSSVAAKVVARTGYGEAVNVFDLGPRNERISGMSWRSHREENP